MTLYVVIILVAIVFYVGYEVGKKSAEKEFTSIMELSGKTESEEEKAPSLHSAPSLTPSSVSSSAPSLSPIATPSSNPTLFTYARCTCGGKDGIEITGYNGFDEFQIIIPIRIDGLSVISIGERAFMNCQISEVVLPSELQQIRKSAFLECKSLQHINIPSGVVTIEDYAFAMASSLRSIDLPNGLTHLGEHAFSSSGLLSITFPASIKKVPNWCCSNCYNLQSVTIHEGITEVGFGAFEIADDGYRYRKGKNLLKYVTIPKSVELVNWHAFKNRINTLNQNGTVLAFQGMQTKMSDTVFGNIHSYQDKIVVYVLPGSEAQKIARSKGFTVKPLNEFPYK